MRAMCVAGVLLAAGMAWGAVVVDSGAVDRAVGLAEDEVVDAVLPAHAPGQVLVRVRDGVSDEQIGEAMRGIGGRVAISYTIVPGLKLVRLDEGVSVREALIELRSMHELVRYAQPDTLCEPAIVPNDPRYSSLYGMTSIRAPQAWDTWTGDPDFVVTVFDSGIDQTHPDLSPNLWVNPGEIAGNGVDDDGNGLIDDVHGWNFLDGNANLSHADGASHGSHVAGTIAAAGNNEVGVTGVCWEAQVMAIKWFDQTGPLSGFISGMQYALSKGVKLSNHSWRTLGTPAVDDVIAEARAQGHLMIVAAGNESTSAFQTMRPSGSTSDNVIKVAAVDRFDNLATFSNWSQTAVQIAAPGVGILSTVSGNGYSAYDGTSMACPHACGVAALLWSSQPGWSYLDVREVLLSTTRAVPGLETRCSTGGVVDAERVMVEAQPIRFRLVSPVPGSVLSQQNMEIELSATGEVSTAWQIVAKYKQPLSSVYESVVPTNVGGGVYRASIPAGACGGTLRVYFEASVDGRSFAIPHAGVGEAFSTVVVPSENVYFEDFDAGTGWTVVNTASSATVQVIGGWDRGVPAGSQAQPQGDRHDAGGVCFATGTSLCSPVTATNCTLAANDLDNGTTTLTSPAVDLSGREHAALGYWFWFSSNKGANIADPNDAFVTRVSGDDGQTWVEVDRVRAGTVEAQGGWLLRVLELPPELALTSTVRVQFVVSDFPPATVIEAAVDDVAFSSCASVAACVADFNGSGGVEVQDIFEFLSAWFAVSPTADINRVDGVNVQDIFDYLDQWFTGCD